MRLLSTLSIILVAFLHIGFAWLEMVAWTQPLGMRIFQMTPDEALITRTLALNQGFYNLMFAGGLLFALSYRGRNTIRVLLIMIVAVGIFGGLTVSPRIFALQAAPALFAWALTRAAVWAEAAESRSAS